MRSTQKYGVCSVYSPLAQHKLARCAPLTCYLLLTTTVNKSLTALGDEARARVHQDLLERSDKEGEGAIANKKL